MAENLKALAQKAFRRANHDPEPSAEAVADMYDFVNTAVQQLSLDAPFLFFEDRLRIQTEKDWTSATDVATDRCILVAETSSVFSGAYNPWTFKIQLAVATDGTATTDSGQVQWAVAAATSGFGAKAWGGRWIDITTDSGRVVRTQIRSVWLESASESGHTVTYAYFTVMSPWPYELYGEGPFSYRVYTDDYYLPDDLIEVRNVRIVGTQHEVPLTGIGQKEADDAGYSNERGSGAGVPRLFFRGRHVQLPGPNTAPSVSNSGSWLGPEPPGEFEYYATYCWGYRSVDYTNPGIALWTTGALEWTETATTSSSDSDRVAAARKREPLWESAPSPVSDAVTVAAPSGSSPTAALITLPNLEYMLGFMLDGTTATGGAGTAFRRVNVAHSGWRVRLYRRRKSATFTNYTTFGDTISGQHIDSLHAMDIQDAAFLLVELRLDEFNEGRWTDDGKVIPDYMRRLRTVNGYQGIRFWPRPDDEYDIEVRCVRRPQALVSASDAPPVHAEAVKLIVDYAAALLYERLGETGNSMARMQDYAKNLDTLRGRYSDIRPSNTPIRRRLARAFGYDRYDPWRRPRGTE